MYYKFLIILCKPNLFWFQNKLFVYRGLEYERIGAFTQRLQTEFPSAQILMKNTPPDETIINSEGQCILLKPFFNS